MTTAARHTESPATAVRDALRIENQQVRPARQNATPSSYDRLLEKVGSKRSMHEVLLAFSTP